MPIVTNLSAMARQIDPLGKAVFTDTGEAIANGLMKEFTQMVQETAQYTGSAAASWNISVGGVSNNPNATVKLPNRSAKTALEKGHHTAVNIALERCEGALDSLKNWIRPGLKGHTPGAIMVENYAPSATHAEMGPLRDVNNPEGAFRAFKNRVRTKTFEVQRNRKI